MQKVIIEKMDNFGRGIAYIDDKIVFVYNALVGEEVIIEVIKDYKTYSLAIVSEYLTKSLKRKDSFCKYYGLCGGCSIEHLSYEDTLLYKKDKLENILSFNNINFPSIKLIENESPKNYRNKLTLKVVDGKIGFYEENSHNIVEIDYCAIASTSINDVIPKLPKLNIKNGIITIRSNYNNELLLIINTLDKIDFNILDYQNNKIVGVILNDKTIYGDNFFYERINKCIFKVSYNAFFQINPFITSKLFEILEKNLTNTNSVLDLYSGVGTLGIIASKKASKVYSVEIVKNAVLDNIQNKKLNHANNIEVFLGDTKKVLPKIKDDFDTIIIDPPRKGLDKNSLQIILNSKADKVIYISCNPMTLVRDLKELVNVYDIERIYLLDMFSYTYHVECVCILKLRDVDLRKNHLFS